jgi:hypothetical protein
LFQNQSKKREKRSIYYCSESYVWHRINSFAQLEDLTPTRTNLSGLHTSIEPCEAIAKSQNTIKIQLLSEKKYCCIEQFAKSIQ